MRSIHFLIAPEMMQFASLLTLLGFLPCANTQARRASMSVAKVGLEAIADSMFDEQISGIEILLGARRAKQRSNWPDVKPRVVGAEASAVTS